MVAVYLAKTAFPQDLVEGKVVYIDASQMSETRLRPRAGPLPQFSVSRSI